MRPRRGGLLARVPAVAAAALFAWTPASAPAADAPLTLAGKTVAFVDPASSSGYIYPMVPLI